MTSTTLKHDTFVRYRVQLDQRFCAPACRALYRLRQLLRCGEAAPAAAGLDARAAILIDRSGSGSFGHTLLCASSSAVEQGGATAASMRTASLSVLPGHNCTLYSDTAQQYSPLRPVAITPSRSSFL
jgi:hypothetical protein